MPSETETKVKTWVHIDKCEPVSRRNFELCLGQKKPVDPITLDTLFSIYDDGAFGDIDSPNPDNQNLFLRVSLTNGDRVALRKILKTNGNLGRLREIDSNHTEDSARHIDQNTKHLAKLAVIQICIGAIQLITALSTVILSFVHH